MITYVCLNCDWANDIPEYAAAHPTLCPECKQDYLVIDRDNDSEEAEEAYDIVAEIASLVEVRGYRDGWTSEQYIARQIIKVQDEVGEATFHVLTPDEQADIYYLMGNMAGLANEAARVFKMSSVSEFDVDLRDRDKLKAELCDIIIPAMVALAELGGTADDILAKAMNDVGRGTNYDDR